MKKITKLDLIIIFLFLFLILIAIKIQFFTETKNKKKLYIYTSKEKYYFNMNKDKIIEIQGDIGITKIEIKDNKFKFIDSACQNKLCINLGWVGINNFSVVCLPNKVSAYIMEEKPEKQYDGISR